MGIGAAGQGARAQAIELIEEAGGAEQGRSRAGDRRHAIDLALELFVCCAVPIQIGLVQLEVSELTDGGQQVIPVVIGIVQTCAVRARFGGKAAFEVIVIGISSAVSVVVAVVPEGCCIAIAVGCAFQQPCACIICILR